MGKTMHTRSPSGKCLKSRLNYLSMCLNNTLTALKQINNISRETQAEHVSGEAMQRVGDHLKRKGKLSQFRVKTF